MPVQQGMNFGSSSGSSSGDNKRKQSSRRRDERKREPSRRTVETLPVIERGEPRDGAQDLTELQPIVAPGAVEEPVAAPVDESVVEPETEATVAVGTVGSTSTEDSDEEDSTRRSRKSSDSTKRSKKSQTRRTHRKPKSDTRRRSRDDRDDEDDGSTSQRKIPKGLLIGLGVAAVVLAIVALVVVVKPFRDRSIDEPVPTPEYTNTTHVDSNEANANVKTNNDAVEVTGYIETDAGFAYQYPNFADGEEAVLVGKIKNISDKDAQSVSIGFFLYDKDGVLLGTAADGTDVIKAGEEWEFHAKSATPIKRDAVARFLVDQIQFASQDKTQAIADAGQGVTNSESAAAETKSASEAASNQSSSDKSSSSGQSSLSFVSGENGGTGNTADNGNGNANNGNGTTNNTDANANGNANANNNGNASNTSGAKDGSTAGANAASPEDLRQTT